jgi:hypothetical protein
MPSIIEQIQKDALDPNFPASALLRKVKLAAAKLKLAKVEDWVDNELKGYNNEVPDYRRVVGRPKALNPMRGWIPISGPAHLVEKISTVPVSQPIAGIESLIADGNNEGLMFPYPPALIEQLNTRNRVHFGEMALHFDRSSAVAIVDAVKTLILEWAVELEKAGITGSDVSFTSDEQQRAQQMGVNIQIGSIHSFTGNLGSTNISGDVITSVVTAEKIREFVSQVKPQIDQLVREGIDREELSSRLTAIERALEEEKDPAFVARLLNELKDTVVKTAGKLVSSGVLTLLGQILGTGAPAP